VSGIIAIVNTDGAPCDPDRLRDLTQALVFRGPDGIATRVRGPAGLGATLFRTTDESAAECQPLSLDGTVWSVADCRVDDRATLTAALRAEGVQPHASASDAELILRAYLAWGTLCVERLIGDFSFAIWDGRDHALFAARDHFGVKPFFYAQLGNLLIVSNTLSCIRRHPDVPADVNEAAIGDFLMFGTSYYPAKTAFRHIQRLPAAHVLRCRDGDVRIERYWQVPDFGEPLRLRCGEIVEHFREVLRTAVADRLRGPAAAVELSGGVDSTSVAVTAADLQQHKAIANGLTAWTFDSRPLVPADREYDLARLTASALGLPHVRRSFAGFTLFRDTLGRFVLPRPEPHDLSLGAADFGFLHAIGESCPVLLTGQGGDGVFRGEALTMPHLRRHSKWLAFTRASVSHTVRRHRLPPLGIRTGIKRLAGRAQPSVPPFPVWIESKFARRECLRDRWHEQWAPRPDCRSAVLRPAATQILREDWATILERHDPECIGSALDVRHPLLDLRVIDFLLQVPAIPWFWDKELPRRACLGRVPSQIRNRRKVPLAGNMILAAFDRGDGLPAKWQSHPQLATYVRCDRIPELPQSASRLDAFQHRSVTYPVSLSLWLQDLTGGYTNEEYREHIDEEHAGTRGPRDG
jgi:asparagine synthase (glutamine-hydrolysing)